MDPPVQQAPSKLGKEDLIQWERGKALPSTRGERKPQAASAGKKGRAVSKLAAKKPPVEVKSFLDHPAQNVFKK